MSTEAQALAGDRELIRQALKYRSGSDSIGSVYMGSMATARVYHLLNLSYGFTERAEFDKALDSADRETIDKILEVCRSVIEYMQKHPTTRCPLCGNITSVKEE